MRGPLLTKYSMIQRPCVKQRQGKIKKSVDVKYEDPSMKSAGTAPDIRPSLICLAMSRPASLTHSLSRRGKLNFARVLIFDVGREYNWRLGDERPVDRRP